MTAGPRITDVDKTTWLRFRDQVLALETELYEPARRDSPETLDRIARSPRGASVLAIDGGHVAGWCLGGPLEDFAHVGGVATDAHLGDSDTLYSADTLVAPGFQGHGLGRRLKSAQVDLARSLGYRRLTGRNRVGLAAAMWHINRSLGARTLAIVEGDYNDDLEPNRCIYYEIEL
jgi:GNAT superfamily N-acetyltransferase